MRRGNPERTWRRHAFGSTAYRGEGESRADVAMRARWAPPHAADGTSVDADGLQPHSTPPHCHRRPPHDNRDTRHDQGPEGRPPLAHGNAVGISIPTPTRAAIASVALARGFSRSGELLTLGDSHARGFSHSGILTLGILSLGGVTHARDSHARGGGYRKPRAMPWAKEGRPSGPCVAVAGISEGGSP